MYAIDYITEDSKSEIRDAELETTGGWGKGPGIIRYPPYRQYSAR